MLIINSLYMFGTLFGWLNRSQFMSPIVIYSLLSSPSLWNKLSMKPKTSTGLPGGRYKVVTISFPVVLLL